MSSDEPTIAEALVQQGYAHGVEESLVKLQYDLYYIKHRSLPLDMLIVVKSAMASGVM